MTVSSLTPKQWTTTDKIAATVEHHINDDQRNANNEYTLHTPDHQPPIGELARGQVAVSLFIHQRGYTQRFYKCYEQNGLLGNVFIWIIRQDGKIDDFFFNIAGAKGKVINVRKHRRSQSRTWMLRNTFTPLYDGPRDCEHVNRHPDNLWEAVYVTGGISFYVPARGDFPAHGSLEMLTTAHSTPMQYMRRQWAVGKPDEISKGKPQYTGGIQADALRYAVGTRYKEYALINYWTK